LRVEGLEHLHNNGPGTGQEGEKHQVSFRKDGNPTRPGGENQSTLEQTFLKERFAPSESGGQIVMHRQPNFGVSPHNPIRVLLWVGRRSRILQECLWAGERHGIVIDLFDVCIVSAFCIDLGFPRGAAGIRCRRKCTPLVHHSTAYHRGSVYHRLGHRAPFGHGIDDLVFRV